MLYPPKIRAANLLTFLFRTNNARSFILRTFEKSGFGYSKWFREAIMSRKNVAVSAAF